MPRVLKKFLLIFIFLPIFFKPIFAADNPLRPNPFELVLEESQKTFSGDKDQMTIGTAVGPGLTTSAIVDKRSPTANFNGSVISDFSKIITPLLLKSSDGSGNNDGSENLLGPITSTCANIDNVFIYQLNPQWSATNAPNHPDYKACTIGGSGCSSASNTVVLNSFGAKTNIVTVWNYQHNHNGYVYFSTDNGQTSCMGGNNFLAPLTDIGMAVEYIGTGADGDWQEVSTRLDNCGLIIASGMAYFPELNNPTGHVIVITGIIKDDNGHVTAIKTLDSGTHRGDGLIRTLGANSGEYAFDLHFMWGVTP